MGVLGAGIGSGSLLGSNGRVMFGHKSLRFCGSVVSLWWWTLESNEGGLVVCSAEDFLVLVKESFVVADGSGAWD